MTQVSFQIPVAHGVLKQWQHGMGMYAVALHRGMRTSTVFGAFLKSGCMTSLPYAVIVLANVRALGYECASNEVRKG
jgi:hypothetical protein